MPICYNAFSISAGFFLIPKHTFFLNLLLQSVYTILKTRPLSLWLKKINLFCPYITFVKKKKLEGHVK